MLRPMIIRQQSSIRAVKVVVVLEEAVVGKRRKRKGKRVIIPWVVLQVHN